MTEPLVRRHSEMDRSQILSLNDPLHAIDNGGGDREVDGVVLFFRMLEWMEIEGAIFKSYDDLVGSVVEFREEELKTVEKALEEPGKAPERDPASYIIYGSATALPTTGSIPMAGLTQIASGTLALSAARSAGPAIVQFNNTTPYASYLVVFPTVKSTTNNNITFDKTKQANLYSQAQAPGTNGTVTWTLGASGESVRPRGEHKA